MVFWATFMPKPFGNLTGNGAHVHVSLADTGQARTCFSIRLQSLVSRNSAGGSWAGYCITHAVFPH